MEHSHHAHRASRSAHRPALYFFGLISVVVLYYSWQVIAPYATPILLAAVAATFTYPLYQRMAEKLGNRPHAAAWIMCLLVTLVLIVPLFLLTLTLVEEAIDVLGRVTPERVTPILNALRVEDLQAWLESFAPGVDLSGFDLDGSLVEIAKLIPGMIVQFSKAFLSGAADLLIGFSLMILTLAYFYVDGKRIVNLLQYLSPLPDHYDRELFDRFRSIVRATLKGSFLTGLVQGAMTSVGFFIVGIPGAVFWGAIAVLFSFLPMIGTALVWIPGVAYLALLVSFGAEGVALWQPIFLAAWGVIIISGIDNLLRPFVMNTDANLPTLILFFSILGGVQAFGFIGILLGPLLFALLATMLHMYTSFFRNALRNQNVEEGMTVTRPEQPA